jgi:SAM-dependent methyltransferase
MSTQQIEERIERVFAAKSNADLIENYQGWAGRYDLDMQSLGYRNPAIISALLARNLLQRDMAVLDAGAGTGLVGELLAILGYGNLTALDLSPEMLELARGKGIYRSLIKGVLGQPLDFADGQFAAIVCAGTLTAGHAPPTAFDELLRVAARGGLLVFTIGTSAYEQGGFRDKLADLERSNRWHLIERTELYHPMPLGIQEATATTRAFVYRTQSA